MSQSNNRFLEIDLIKAMAIILVIFGHTFSYVQQSTGTILPTTQGTMHIINLEGLSLNQILTKWMTYSGLLTQQVVPVFIVLMGHNFGMSYTRKKYVSLRQIYSVNEFVRRFKRLLVPFAIAFISSIIIGIIVLLLTGNWVLYFGPYLLTGFLPINGPGNYFLSIIFEFLIIFPLMYIAYHQHPKLLIGSSLLCALIFELLRPSSGIYSISIIRFLPLIALGLWISTDHNLFAKRNLWLLPLGIFSGFYIILVNQFEYQFTVLGINFFQMTKSQNLFACFYTVLLVLVGIQVLQKSDRWPCIGIVALIGKASYHIFLVQIIYFGVNKYFYTHYHSIRDIFTIDNVEIILINLIICIIVGIIFYKLQEWLMVGNNKDRI